MMRQVSQVGNYDVCQGYPDVPTDLIELQRLQGGFEMAVMGEEYIQRMPQSAEYEEEGIAAQDVAQASVPLEDFRMPVRSALRAILYSIFERYNLPKAPGLDVGCGATGGMVEKLLPLDSNTKTRWTQMDVNPSAVKENQRRHPQSRIQRGSYLNLGTADAYSLITGLSSLDSTAFIKRAIQQIRDALVQGGFFLHFQEIQPGWIAPVQEMMAMGENFPYKVEVIPPNKLDWSPQHRIFPHNVILYHTQRGEILSNMELFRRYLARTIRATAGMELLENDWFTAIGPSGGPSNAFFYNSGFRFRSSNPNVQIASGIITLARKTNQATCEVRLH